MKFCDAVLMQTVRGCVNKKIFTTVYFKNARYLAFLLAVSASRNYRLTPVKETAIRLEWERRGGKLPLHVIFNGRAFLDYPVFITGRRKIGTHRGVSSSDTGILMDVQKITTEYGDKYFTKEALLSLDIDWVVLQRLVMRGFVLPSRRQGQNYYRVVSPTTEISWDIPSYPPAYMFGEGAIVHPVDRIISTILPVPVTLKELTSTIVRKYDTTPLRRRIYSGGGEEGHVVSSCVDDSFD